MNWLEMHNVEYGECIVLGGRRDEILMVDCGSVNQKIREGDVEFSDYVDPSIIERYSGCTSRAFLLTHYHRDHLCGLIQLLKAEPGYFQRIYLPEAPVDRAGRPLLIEFALFVYAFTAHLTEFSRANLAVLRVFEAAAKLSGADSLFPLSARKSFYFDAVCYDVLWPRAQEYPFSPLFASTVEDMNVCLSSPFLPDIARDFMRLKDSYCRAYLQMCSSSPVKQENIDACTDILCSIEAMRPQLALLPPAPDIIEILSRPVTLTAYSDELNASSVVFHNRREKEASLDDILMTGDITPAALDEIKEELYGGYYIIKAPHHGTKAHWHPLLAELGASHVLISNGDYKQGGAVAQEYLDQPAIKHCTNNNACAWFRASGCSCNRMTCCYDQPGGNGLALKCPRVRGGDGPAPCGIYVLGPGGARSCLCDSLPALIN